MKYIEEYSLFEVLKKPSVVYIGTGLTNRDLFNSVKKYSDHIYAIIFKMPENNNHCFISNDPLIFEPMRIRKIYKNTVRSIQSSIKKYLAKTKVIIPNEFKEHYLDCETIVFQNVQLWIAHEKAREILKLQHGNDMVKYADMEMIKKNPSIILMAIINILNSDDTTYYDNISLSDKKELEKIAIKSIKKNPSTFKDFYIFLTPETLKKYKHLQISNEFGFLENYLFESAVSENEWVKRILDFLNYYYEMFDRSDDEFLSKNILMFLKKAKQLKISSALRPILINSEFNKKGSSYSLKFPGKPANKEDALIYYKEALKIQSDWFTKRREENPEWWEEVKKKSSKQSRDKWANDPEFHAAKKKKNYSNWKKKIKEDPDWHKEQNRIRVQKAKDALKENPDEYRKHRNASYSKWEKKKKKEDPEWWEERKRKMRERYSKKNKKKK